MATEKQYDDEIAPLLMEAGKRCKALGISLVARVEWAPDEYGITQFQTEDASIGQRLALLAAHAKGNFDGLCIAAVKSFGPGNSIYLNR